MVDAEVLSNTETDPSTEAAAARAEVKKKQANSYYYWHGHEKERARVGDVAPMPKPVLLMKTEATETPNSIISCPITKHSWCDSKKSVTVYIDTKVEGKETMVEGTLQVEFGKRRLEVSYIANVQTSKDVQVQRRKTLTLCLAKAIKRKESSYKVKTPGDQIVIRLVKAEDFSWWELTSKDGKSADDTSDSDEDEEQNEENEEDKHVEAEA